MAEVLSGGGSGRDRYGGARLDRRFLRRERRPVRRPHRLHQHGQGDFVRRTGAPVAGVRGLSAQCRRIAERRAGRTDDAESATISDRALRRIARRLCGRELQPALFAPGVEASTRRFGRGSDRRPRKFRSDARKGDRRDRGRQRRRHRRRRPPERAARAHDQFRAAPCSAGGSGLEAAAGRALRPRAGVGSNPDARAWAGRSE